MTVSITWSVTNMDRTLSDGKVSNVHYRVDAVSGEHTAGAYGSVGVDDEVSIPYDQITEDIAVTWTKQELGPEQVAALEAGLVKQVEEMANPVQGSGLPWDTYEL